MNCKNCKSNKYYAKPSGRKIGLYCANCNTWISWITYSDICKLYENKDNKPIDDNVQLDDINAAFKRISKSKKRVTTMQCSKCGCPLYDSSKPKVQYRFNLVNAKFCPKCGRQFIL